MPRAKHVLSKAEGNAKDFKTKIKFQARNPKFETNSKAKIQMTSPFLYENGDRFPVLDLIASFQFKSPGSVSFDLGTESDTLHFNFPDSSVLNLDF